MRFYNKKKLILSILLILVIAVLLWSLIWYVNYQRYNEYITVDYNKYGDCYVKKNEKEYYTVSCPAFGTLTGNYAVSNSENTITLIIWPDYIGEVSYTYGMEILNKETKFGYRFYVNEEMQYVESDVSNFSEREKKEIYKFLNGNRTEILYLFSKASKEWNLDS